MGLRDRFSIIGRAIRGEPEVKEVIKEVEKIDKGLLGSTVDFFTPTGTTSTRISSKLLEANKGWVYRNNDVIAKEVSTIDFELFTTRLVGQEIQFKPITSHPVLDVLDKFNDFTAAPDGFYITQSHKKLTGNCFWYVEGTGANVTNIFILPPDKVQIKIGRVSGKNADIESYDYQDSIAGKAVKESYDPDEIIHFKTPNPNNFLRGVGAVEAAADDIDMDTLAIEANKQMFMRGLIANIVLTTDKSVSPEQITKLESDFRSKHTGVHNAFRVPVLSGGLKPVPIQLTNKEMELIAQQEWVRDKIASIFGNSKAVLGVTDDVNRANAESTIINWKRTTVRAEMKQITDTLNEFLIPRFGTNLILGFKDPVPEDKAAVIADVKAMIEANVITQNEARELLGYENIQGGDELRESLNIPLIPKSLQFVDFKKVLRKQGLYEKAMAYEELYPVVKKATDKIAKDIVSKKKSAKPSKKTFNSDKIANYYSKQIRLVEAIEKIFEDKVEKFINKLVEKAIAQVPNEVRDMQSKALFNEEQELTQAVLDFTPLLNELSVAAGTEAMRMIDSDKPYLATKLKPKIRKRVELFAASMIATDKDKLIDMIAGGIQDGLSVPEIRNNILDTFEDYSKMQAQRITRTEVLRASNQAALDAWEESDIVEGKQWLTAPGADEECAVYEGQIIYDLKGNFFSPQNEFEDGDPPIHPNCRCVVLPVLSDVTELTADQLKIINQKNRIQELESKIDKRTKAFKQLKAIDIDEVQYISSLEKLLSE